MDKDVTLGEMGYEQRYVEVPAEAPRARETVIKALVLDMERNGKVCVRFGIRHDPGTKPFPRLIQGVYAGIDKKWAFMAKRVILAIHYGEVHVVVGPENG